MTHDRRKETQTVKQALRGAGYRKIKAGHGRGTGWGWIHVAVQRDERQPWATQYRGVIDTVQQATGRHGEYHGNISVSLDT